MLICRRFGPVCSQVVCVIAVAGAVCAALLSGCGGSEAQLVGAPTIYPGSVTVSPGETRAFYPGVFEVDQHKTSEGLRVVEADGGTIALAATEGTGASGGWEYTAPNHTGVYHVQNVWDAGTSSEKTATATITVVSEAAQ